MKYCERDRVKCDLGVQPILDFIKQRQLSCMGHTQNERQQTDKENIGGQDKSKEKTMGNVGKHSGKDSEGKGKKWMTYTYRGEKQGAME